MLILTGFAMILTSKNKKEKYCNETEECCWRLQQKMTKEFNKCMTEPRQQKYWFIGELQLRQYFCLNTKKSFSRENVWDNKRCFYKAFHSLRHQRKSGKEVSVGVLTKASSQRWLNHTAVIWMQEISNFTGNFATEKSLELFYWYEQRLERRKLFSTNWYQFV